MGGVGLLSGGLDSTVAVAWAVRHGGLDLALTVNYGQQCATREQEAAARIASHLQIGHRVVEVPFLAALSSSAIVDRSARLPAPSRGDLDDFVKAGEVARQVWIPNRNGLLVNIAACYAESIGAERIVVGFNAEEAATFPDNSDDFVEAATAALAYSTLNRVRVESPGGGRDKTQLVKLGLEVEAPLRLIWSCYRDGRTHCWQCASCQRLMRALEENGILESFQRRREG